MSSDLPPRTVRHMPGAIQKVAPGRRPALVELAREILLFASVTAVAPMNGVPIRRRVEALPPLERLALVELLDIAATLVELSSRPTN